MTGMQLLGEPFVFGVESAREFMESNGFRCHQSVSSDVFLGERRPGVLDLSFLHRIGGSRSARRGGSGR